MNRLKGSFSQILKQESVSPFTQLSLYQTFLLLLLLMGIVPFSQAAIAQEVYYYLPDHLGSTTVLIDQTGNRLQELAYLPYGQVRQNTGSVDADHKFTGQEFDAEIGLYYYGARYYDPALMHFISADTIEPNRTNPQTLNRYSYVQNNPVKYIDPTGHFAVLPLIPIIWGAIEAGLSAYDVYSTVETFRDPNATFFDKSLALGGLALGTILPGGGYGKGAQEGADLGRKLLITTGDEFVKPGGEGITKLYRAVSEAEFKQIMQTGKFEVGPNSLAGKFFAESLEDAAKWGDALQGSGNYRIVEMTLPTDSANELMRWNRLDDIGPARYGELDQLKDAIIRPIE
jgi:RHS repeat-associated protein